MQITGVPWKRVVEVMLRCLLSVGFGSIIATMSLGREKILLDENWKFLQSDLQNGYSDEVDDSALFKWRSINLPHDWSIEQAIDPDARSSGAGGYFSTGKAWYRKVFVAPESWQGKTVDVEFEGVSPNAEVWINGQKLGKHHYGYTPFRHDLSAHLRYGEQNTLAVRVDNSLQPNSRWYAGSGIYRHVWLHVIDEIHIDERTVLLSTKSASQSLATVAAAVPVVNRSALGRRIGLEIELLDPHGMRVGLESSEITLPAGATEIVTNKFAVSEPQLWSSKTPELYECRIRLSDEDGELDLTAQPFGIRTVQVSSDNGVLLNGQTVLLFGANVHHDNGPLGAAAFDQAEQRRVQLLKQAGFNAIRTAHNPPSTAFLDACDQLGMLVVLEAFDGWAAKKNPYDYGTVFHDNWERDLTTTILRDRNHPSVIMWSIGNEVFERGKPAGLEIAKQMTRLVKQLDNSRPVTAGLNGLGVNRKWEELDTIFKTLDVAGYNYELNRHAADHARVPDRVIICAESYPQSAFESWQATNDASYVVGDFVWTGMDYLGEAGIGRVFGPNEALLPHWEGEHFPWHGAACGDLDLTGWRKPLSHYRNIVWDRGEKLYVSVRVPEPSHKQWQLSKWAHPPSLPCWTWPGLQREKLTVEVFSRYPRVRLYLDDQMLGERPTNIENQFQAHFQVAYKPGRLRAVGVDGSRELAECEISTSGEPYAIRLSSDRANVHANGQNLAFITVEIVDQNGNRCWHAGNEIRYALSGPGSIAGIGSGDLTSRESYRSNPRRAFQGRSLFVVRTSKTPGTITISASSAQLKEAIFTLESFEE